MYSRYSLTIYIYSYIYSFIFTLLLLLAGFGGLIRGGVHGHQTRGLPASAARGGAEEGRQGAAVRRGNEAGEFG